MISLSISPDDMDTQTNNSTKEKPSGMHNQPRMMSGPACAQPC